MHQYSETEYTHLNEEMCKASFHNKQQEIQYEMGKRFSWLEYNEDCKGAFCKVCRKSGKSLQRTGGVWVTKPFTNWKKAVEKMKAHEKSLLHSQANQAALAAEGALREGSIIQQLQKVDRQERIRNRAAIKSLIRCTHFLTRQHIPHTTNFDKLVDLVVACGGDDLKHFLEKECRIHISHRCSRVCRSSRYMG